MTCDAPPPVGGGRRIADDATPAGRRSGRLIVAVLVLASAAALAVVLRLRPLRRPVPFVEHAAAFLFLLAAVGIPVAAFGILVGRLKRRLAGVRAPAAPVRLWTERIVLSLGVAGLACMAYGWRVEPCWPEVVRVRLASPKLAGAARPFRLVFISDLHSDAAPRLEECLPGIVAAERPDAVAFGGDLLNDEAGLPVARRCLSEMSRLAPTFAVRGNWDSWYWTRPDLFGGTGVHELNGEAVPVAAGGATVWIAGVPVTGEGRAGPALEGVRGRDFTVFLYHYPYPEIVAGLPRSPDLLLSGHVHGGQIALPGYGALVTLSKHGKRYESGRYDCGGMTLYVSRGIGMEGGPFPRVRFGARPEVTVFELVPE